MDISFTCEKCGQHLVVDESARGVTVPCPTCASDLTIPATGGTTPDPPQANGPLEPTLTGAANSTNFDDYIDTMDAPHFCGNFRRSNSGQYVIAWGSTDRQGGGGECDRVYMLFRDGALLLKGTRKYLQSAVVADNGTFLLLNSPNNSPFHIVTVRDRDGRRLRQIRAAWIYDPSLDACKRIANLGIPADYAHDPPGAITFDMLDGSVTVHRPPKR
jgi:hypothetical protein